MSEYVLSLSDPRGEYQPGWSDAQRHRGCLKVHKGHIVLLLPTSTTTIATTAAAAAVGAASTTAATNSTTITGVIASGGVVGGAVGISSVKSWQQQPEMRPRYSTHDLHPYSESIGQVFSVRGGYRLARKQRERKGESERLRNECACLCVRERQKKGEREREREREGDR